MEALDLQQGYVSPEAIQYSSWLSDTCISIVFFFTVYHYQISSHNARNQSNVGIMQVWESSSIPLSFQTQALFPPVGKYRVWSHIMPYPSVLMHMWISVRIGFLSMTNYKSWTDISAYTLRFVALPSLSISLRCLAIERLTLEVT